MTPSNDPPEIPSLKPSGKDEEKKGGGLLPSASSASKPASSGFKFPGFGSKGLSAPNLRVRGMGGGSTVMDRLKNLRKKDLIFIAAGLCTLGMAPLAEHMLMSPDEQTGKLQEGFDSKGPLFADGSSVYEQGSGVGSPGGLVGQGTDVITPLNVRDPSNLVMSPGATKKPDAVVAPPPAAPSTGKGEPDWRDVLKDSAKSGASAGTQKAAKLPKPNVKMAGAIRGLSALGGGGGGTGAALKLDPLKASAPNKAAASNALTRSQATPGFRGVGARSNASSGAGEALRAAGMRQSDILNRGGSAANALETAAKEAIPTGGVGSGGGGPGKGDETKNPGGNNVKESKQLGESLAFLRQKMEQEKAIDLKWKKKEWKQFGRQKMMEESAIKMGFDMFGKFAEKAFLDPLAGAIAQAVEPGPDPVYKCTVSGVGEISGTKSQLARMGFTLKAGGILWPAGKETGAPAGRCVAVSEETPTNPEDPNADPRNPNRVSGPARNRLASPTQASMQGAWDRYCAPNAPEALTGANGAQSDTCAKLQILKTEVDNTLPTIEKYNHDALTFIGQGYEKLKAAHGHLDKGIASLGSVTGGKEKPEGPFLTIQKNFTEAQNGLGQGKNADGKEKLEKAKTEGYEKAVGQGGSAASFTAGALLADSKGMEPLAEQQSTAGKADLDSAAAQVKAGHALADSTLQKVQGMQPPAEAAGIPIVTRVRTEIGQTIAKLKDDLTKTGGTDGTDGGYNKTALDVHANHVEKLRADVYGPQKARDEVVAATTLAENVINQTKQGTWVEPNPAAVPPLDERAAAAQNLAAVQADLGKFVTDQGTARVTVVNVGVAGQAVKTKVDACAKAFTASSPSC